MIDLIKACLAASMVCGLISAISSDSGIPGIQRITLGILPFYILSATVASAFWLWAGREKKGEAMANAFFLIIVGAGVGILVSFFKIWNDGGSFLVLSPREAWFSILTFGTYPARFGPLVSVRFLPAVVFFGLGFLLSRGGAPKAKAWLCSGGAYLILAFSYHAMSWIAWVASFSGQQSVSTAADTFRSLVRMHAVSYWSQAQLDRFLVPLGRQAESTLDMVHASIIFLLVAGLLAAVFIKSFRASAGLVKRLVAKSSALWILPVTIGVALPLTSQSAKTSYTHALALLVFAVSIMCWIAWWRFGRDIENLAQDELRQADLPLPRGEVSLQEMENVRHVLLGICLLGAWLLGWPVFIGMATAVVAVWLVSRYGAGLGDSLATGFVGHAVIGLCLAWAGAAVALCDASSPVWITSMLLGTALLVGLSRLFKDMGDTFLTSRFAIWISIAVLIAASIITRQKVMWIPVIAFALLVFWFSRDVQKWRRYGVFSMDMALVFIAFIVLFIPQLIRHQ